MAMRLAFYQLDNEDGGPSTGARNWQTAANDAMADRPEIPTTVITWPQQASDRSEPVRATPLRRSLALTAAYLEAAVMAVLFAALVASVVFGGGPVLERALSADSAKPAARGVATVETRILSLEPVATPAAVAHGNAK